MFKLKCEECGNDNFNIYYDNNYNLKVVCNKCGEKSDISFELAQLAKCCEETQSNSGVTIDRNVSKKSRAFASPDVDYYVLQQDVGILQKGTVFYHDTEDSVRGSIGAGCLKLCWTYGGGCQSGLCGDTVVFHATFKDTPLFRKGGSI
jgi:hypothetical protein